jgi:nucleoside-diphosphate-sugar epimerase
LMYQSLIWLGILVDDPRRLRAALNAEDLQRLADALVDGVGRDSELGSDFLRAEMLCDKTKAIELTRTEPRNPLGDGVARHVH